MLKSEVKIGAVHEIGCRLDDSLDGMIKDLYRTEGASSVWTQILAMIETMNRNVDKEIDDGKIDLETASNIRRYLNQLINTLTTSNKQAEQNKAAMTGKVQALQLAIQITKTYKDEEMNKLQVLQAAIAKGYVKPTEDGSLVNTEGPRPEGIHPGMSLKQKRLAEQSLQITQEKSEEIQPVQLTEEKQTKPKSNKKGKKQ